MSDALSDEDTAAHAKALKMLETALIGWFTTVGKDGTPRSVPVWFWWEDGRVFVLTKPDAGKVVHVRRGSPVLFHLDSGGPFGDDVVILHGTAEVSPEPTKSWLATRRAAYETKYAAAIADYGMAFEEIAEVFAVTLMFTPGRLQAW